MKPLLANGLPWALTLAVACADVEPPPAEGQCLAVMPGTLEFPAVEVACRGHARSVRVRNECSTAIALSTRVEPHDGFGLVSRPGVRLEPGVEATIELAFHPAVPGETRGELVVESGEEALSVSLIGRATPLAWREESWVVAGAPALVDVIFVVDDSLGHAATAELTYRNLLGVARYYAASGAEVRLGVLSANTAAQDHGRWRRAPSGLEWVERPSPEAFLALAAPRGETESPASCLGALLAASEGGVLGALRRDGARLDVVCLTGQQDAFPGAFVPAFEQVRAALVDPAQPWRTSFSVVARFTEGLESCAAAGSLDDGRLRTLASLGGGVIDDVCVPNWAATLSNVFPTHGWAVPGPFFLVGAPDPGRAPLELRVDDVVIPGPGPSSWAWRPEQNALVLSPHLVPEPGRVVRLRYAPACPANP